MHNRQDPARDAGIAVEQTKSGLHSTPRALATAGACTLLCALTLQRPERTYWANEATVSACAALLFLLWAGIATRDALTRIKSVEGLSADLKAKRAEIMDLIAKTEAKLGALQIQNSPGAEGASQAAINVRGKPLTDNDDPSVQFPENKIYRLEHMRLNNFEGIKDFSFENVLSKLEASQQETFRRFSDQFDQRLAQADIDKDVFYQNPDNFTRLRFLQADDYNVEAALKRLLESVKWRQNFGVDKFLENPNMGMVERYRHVRVRRIVGIDKTGSPLIIERLGEFLASEESFRSGMTLDQWIMASVWDLCEIQAAFREASEVTGRYQHKVNYIGDLTGTRLSGVLRIVGSIKALTKVAEANFPESAGYLIVINAPPSAAIGWSIVKRFLDPKVAEKINILSGPAHDFVKSLYGETVLPVEFGGTNPYKVPHAIHKSKGNELDTRFPMV